MPLESSIEQLVRKLPYDHIWKKIKGELFELEKDFYWERSSKPYRNIYLANYALRLATEEGLLIEFKPQTDEG